MRRTLITIGVVGALLVAGATAFAGVPAKTAGVAKTAIPEKSTAPAPLAPVAAPPGDSTAYEQAVTAYLNNVVDKARQRAKRGGSVRAARQRMSRAYPPLFSRGGMLGRRTLPRVERIAIGIERRAVLDAPDGGRLRVAPGARTPYGEVTAIRAAGVWFLARGAHTAVQLADVSAHEHSRALDQQGAAPMSGPPMRIPPPPNFPSGAHQR
jgi:hypothetical protein